ncbi:MAG: hypothetical protein FWC69_02690 [Defluviitaleaceae bacterium]|nr:hypothetical protein [Defluviitaleaceae bacterium]
MSRNDRIKLYKKIRSEYFNDASRLPKDEIEKAMEDGYLLKGHEVFVSHNQVLEEAKERVAKIDKADIANAFLYSLSTNLCEYRSSLLSYYYIRSIDLHELDDIWINDGKEYQTSYCDICKYNNNKANSFAIGDHVFSDFRSANHAMIMKYLDGSVCWWAYYLDNCIMDITQFLQLEKVEPSAEDKQIFLDALNLTKQLEPTAKAGAYVKLLHQSKIIPKSTRGQIVSFVSTLGSLNILHKPGDYAIVKGKDKYDKTFRDPKEYKNDYPFPLTHWTAADGVDWGEVKEIFDI